MATSTKKSGAGLMVIVAIATSIGCDLVTARYPAFREPSAATYTARTFAVGPAHDRDTLAGAAVTPEFFREAQAPLAIGRAFHAPDLDGAPVVILSHALWARKYGSDPGVIGREIEIDGRPTTVVGVAVSGFAFPKDAALWIPKSR